MTAVAVPPALVEAVVTALAAYLETELTGDMEELGRYLNMRDFDPQEFRYLGEAHVNSRITSLLAGVLDELGEVTVSRGDARRAVLRMGAACHLLVYEPQDAA